MIEVESRDGINIVHMAADDNRFSHQLVVSLEFDCFAEEVPQYQCVDGV